jgi:hypothetical protein
MQQISQKCSELCPAHLSALCLLQKNPADLCIHRLNMSRDPLHLSKGKRNSALEERRVSLRKASICCSCDSTSGEMRNKVHCSISRDSLHLCCIEMRLLQGEMRCIQRSPAASLQGEIQEISAASLRSAAVLSCREMQEISQTQQRCTASLCSRDAHLSASLRKEMHTMSAGEMRIQRLERTAERCDWTS